MMFGVEIWKEEGGGDRNRERAEGKVAVDRKGG